MKKLIILRGWPGSGKSTLARKLIEEAKETENPVPSHYEADMWFEQNGGFSREKLSTAHDWCFESVVKDLDEGRTVIVSNTFTKLWELQRYLLHCETEGIPFEITRCRGEYQNIHGCPDETVLRMKLEYQPHPTEV
jgi:predicted kinase